MLLARKLRSTIQLYRRKGLQEVAGLAQIRVAALCQAHRPVPSDPRRRALMLAATLNRWSGVSRVAIDEEDASQVRDALLVPYLRHRFKDVADAGSRSMALRPVEVAVIANCLMWLWDYRQIDAALPAWTEAVAGTKFALRIAQTARRVSLRLGRLGEAARGIETTGDDLGSLLLRGDILDALGRMEDAAAAYEAAVRRDGSDPEARRAHGFNMLKAGHILDGLASWSVSDALLGNYPLRRHRPRWTGEPLGNRRLMVLFEHGLGDMIQVARFLPRLLAREPGATVLGRVPVPLAGLMARAFPDVSFVTDDAWEPDYDVFVPSMHLAAVLDAADLEPRTRYIDLGEPVRPKGGRPRIGVCWRGHPRQYEATRSIPLEIFARLFERKQADFVVLLNRLTPEEAASLTGFNNVEVPPIADFVDLAAVVASCDLVVSVDTAVVHLAAAGGVPVLLLSRPDPCWRWGASGFSTPWYDTVEVLRHGGDMDWVTMLATAAGRIAARCLQPATVGA